MALILNPDQIQWYWGESELLENMKIEVFSSYDCWSDLNGTSYIERSYVSDAPFSIRIGSVDTRGVEKSGLEIFKTSNIGKRLEWRDQMKLGGNNKEKF